MQLKIESGNKIWMQCIALASIILLVVYVTFGMYLEDNEAIVAALNYGVFGSMGSEQFFSDYQTFLLPVFYQISCFFPSAPVYGIWKLLLDLLILTVLICYIKKELTLKEVSSKFSQLIAITILIYLLLDSLVFQHCIRHSILLSFVALLLNWQSIETERKTSALALLIFFMAVVTRMHAATIMLGLFMAFHFFSGMPVTKIIKHHWVMFLMGASFILFYQLYGIYTPNMGKYIEANYEYAIIEKASLHPLGNMKTARDTAKYVAVKNFLLSDSAEITKAFFAKAVNLKYEQKPFFDNQNVEKALQELKNKFGTFKYTLLFLPVLFVAMLFSGFSTKRIWQTLLIALLGIAVMFMLLLVLVDEIKIRFFSPYVAMVLLVMFLINFPAYLKRTSARGKWVGLPVILFLLCLKGFELYDTVIQKQQKEMAINESAERLHAYCTQYPVLIFMGADIPFYSNLFYRTATTQYPKLASFDGGYLIYFSYAKNRFENLFHQSPLDYPALLNLFEHNPEIKFYATAERLALVSNYFEVVYHARLQFELVTPQPLLHLNGRVFTVRVERLNALLIP